MAASPASVTPSKANPATDGKPVQVKLVLLGEAAVGKSSVVLRFVQNDFQENKEPTIGAAFLTQKCRLEDKIIKFEIWDTAGQERFHSLAPMYYRNAQAAIVAYDITKSSSLDKAKSWVKELQRQGHPNIVIALIGNKLDLVQSDASQSASTGSSTDDEADDATATPDNATTLPDSNPTNLNASSSKRQVPKEEAEAYAQENSLLFFETSAKTGEGIVETFTQIAGKIPLDAILSGRGNNNAGGRAGAANRGSGGTTGANNNEDSRINLANNEAAKKDGCAC
ncbi:hypothetical protein MJO28_004203 [Puccinia striiformis f. sp. tritici]|uniref:Rab family, other n=3 Tax=Puccinia striiformis TaxID=27350 RepID=A0A0L0V218_9BASI|nr:hypothetical protein Pst134EA_007198 [Puccinia striiformis f. sp. tritici]KAI9608471.1 hypothetical protein H4Q26_004653 [Puccinia striiformis f. sp. tritici PST-130]KNE93014.1 hypothetical protein PSTG_13588 [Puccinia striiformis f. sp. tritici PST-78]POW06778.1 hypothetical protein PSTT_08738 [Puccinia striiformis]KAH9460135.1 hypothetical protein Pst134EB_008335 [Puccinia striiformis f. sp. tritici]KAH9469925.1 hypothetical protein Pst134EA_007198 [Puccinia striiformis f. sp. tritici]